MSVGGTVRKKVKRIWTVDCIMVWAKCLYCWEVVTLDMFLVCHAFHEDIEVFRE